MDGPCLCVSREKINRDFGLRVGLPCLDEIQKRRYPDGSTQCYPGQDDQKTAE